MLSKIISVFLVVILAVAISFWKFPRKVVAPVANSPKSHTITLAMKITSSAFSENSSIPSVYTCDAQGINPPLTFADVPPQAKSLALIVDDPDAPIGTFVHWVVFNIPPTTFQIADGEGIPGAISGKNGAGNTKFIGPCPPNGQHRYFFKLYALDTMLSLSEGSTKEDVEYAMQGHILAQAQLVGLYKRK